MKPIQSTLCEEIEIEKLKLRALIRRGQSTLSCGARWWLLVWAIQSTLCVTRARAADAPPKIDAPPKSETVSPDISAAKEAAADAAKDEPTAVPSIAAPFIWTEKIFALPQSIKVFEGVASTSDKKPLHAWYVDVDYKDAGLSAVSVLSNAASGKEPTSNLAKRLGAFIAVNSGYFDMESKPTKTLSLVLHEGKILVPPAVVGRNKKRYRVARGALGVLPNRGLDIAWVAERGASLERHAQPLPAQILPDTNTNQTLVPVPDGTLKWMALEGTGGGPMLIKDGERVESGPQELFGDGQVSSRHPRTAVGIAPDNHLIFLLVDGRQKEHSVGLSLAELTRAMHSLGCRDALNLDGGGSSTLVVNGAVLNKPSGGIERHVPTIFAVVPISRAANITSSNAQTQAPR